MSNSINYAPGTTITGATISGASNTITNVSLTTGVTGTLPIANGGTGSTTGGNLIPVTWANDAARASVYASIGQIGFQQDTQDWYKASAAGVGAWDEDFQFRELFAKYLTLFGDGSASVRIIATGTGDFSLNSGTNTFSFTNGTASLTIPAASAITLAGTGTLTVPATGTAALLGTANTFTAAQTVSVAATASTPATIFTGAAYTGGTGTTAFPSLFLQPTGATAATTWSTAGTFFGANAATGFTGNFIDVKLAGAATSAFKVTSAGAITAGTTINGTTITASDHFQVSNSYLYSGRLGTSSGAHTLEAPAGTVASTGGIYFRNNGNGGLRGFGVDIPSGSSFGYLVASAVSGSAAALTATGDGADIGVTITPKGTGLTTLAGTGASVSGTFAVTGAATLAAAVSFTPNTVSPGLNAGGIIATTATSTILAINGNNALTLADGTTGQIRTIVCGVVTAAGTATLSPTTTCGFTSVAFTAVGQSVVLQFFTTYGWAILSVRGATVT